MAGHIFTFGTIYPTRKAGENVLENDPIQITGPGVSLLVNCDTQADIDELWDKLSEGGHKQPCGQLQDKFGVSWQIVTPKLGEFMSGSDAKRSKRVMAAMLQMEKINIKMLEDAYSEC